MDVLHYVTSLLFSQGTVLQVRYGFDTAVLLVYILFITSSLSHNNSAVGAYRK